MRIHTITTAALLANAGSVIAGDMYMNFALHPRATFSPLTNLQTFTSALGGATADPITNSGTSSRLFEVEGNTFTDLKSAWTRSCNNQKNTCADIANSNKNAGFKVSDCDSQETKCIAAESTATQTSFPTLTSSDANFDFFCDP